MELLETSKNAKKHFNSLKVFFFFWAVLSDYASSEVVNFCEQDINNL